MRLRVLQSFNQPKGDDNPFLQLTVSSLPPEIDCVFFSWRTALFGRYDVFHVHWIESLVAGHGRRKTAQAWVALSLLLVRLRVLRTPVVRTLHNRSARGRKGRAIEERLKLYLDQLTVTYILMNSGSLDTEPAHSVLIPHGHYRDWYERFSRPEPVPGQILNFGLIRTYKGLDQLLPAFSGWEDREVRLRIVGKVADQGLGKLIRDYSQRDHRVALFPGHASEETLAREIGQCEFVVLPYEELYNSGCLLLALSLNRPVLVPDGDVATGMTREIGPNWIYTYSGDLDTSKLARAAVAIRSDSRSHSPDLSKREWEKLGRELADVYETAKS